MKSSLSTNRKAFHLLHSLTGPKQYLVPQAAKSVAATNQCSRKSNTAEWLELWAVKLQDEDNL